MTNRRGKGRKYVRPNRRQASAETEQTPVAQEQSTIAEESPVIAEEPAGAPAPLPAAEIVADDLPVVTEKTQAPAVEPHYPTDEEFLQLGAECETLRAGLQRVSKACVASSAVRAALRTVQALLLATDPPASLDEIKQALTAASVEVNRNRQAPATERSSDTLIQNNNDTINDAAPATRYSDAYLRKVENLRPLSKDGFCQIALSDRIAIDISLPDYNRKGPGSEIICEGVIDVQPDGFFYQTAVGTVDWQDCQFFNKVAEAKFQKVAEAEIATDFEPGTQVQSGTKVGTNTEVETKVEVQTKVEVEPKVDVESEVEAEPRVEIESEVEVEPKVEAAVPKPKVKPAPIKKVAGSRRYGRKKSARPKAEPKKSAEPNSAMPGAGGTKRLKGKRVTRDLVIGSEAWALNAGNRPPGIPEDHTKGWRVYVRNRPGGPDLTTWLRKVQFKLFHTYPNNLRTIDSPPFEVPETGWGGFAVDIRLHFAPITGEKPQWRQHYLQLEPFGTDEEQAIQRRDNMVRSEFLEIVEFNEPTEALWEALVSEDQWAYLDNAALACSQWMAGPGPGGMPAVLTPTAATAAGTAPGLPGAAGARGRAASLTGGGGMRNGMAVDANGVPRTVQLPERTTPGNTWSREYERSYLRALEDANKVIEEQLGELDQRKAVLEEKMASLAESGDMVAKRR